MLPTMKMTPLYPPVWGAKGSDAGLGIRLLPGAKVFYVQYGHPNADDNNDGTDPDYPLATLAQAVANCTANKGDVIYVGPGHAETYSTAAALTIDKAGISIIGFGNGADRPAISFNGVVGADINITAASVKIENFLFKALLDGLTGPLHLTGNDFTLRNCEFRDSSLIEAAAWLATGNGVARLTIDGLWMNGASGGDASVNPLKFDGVAGAEIKNSRFTGKASTAFVNFVAHACSNIFICDCEFYNAGTALTKNIVDTITGSTWLAVNCFSGEGGYSFSGGSGAALASDDVSALSTQLAAFVNASERAIEKSDGTVTNPTDDLFTVAGGPVMVKEFVGVVTTVIGGPGPSTCQIQITTTDPAGTVNLSTAVAIETDAVGTTYTFTAAAPGVLTPTTPGALANVPVERWLCPIGTIKAAFSAGLTGNIKWYMVYQPLSPNSVVAAAA